MNDEYLYESELEELLLEQSRKQYGIENMSKLVPYLLRRYFVVSLENLKLPKTKSEELPAHFMRFWFNDLSVPIHNQTFFYKNIEFSLSIFYGSPIKNIYEDILHQYETSLILSGENPNTKDIWVIAKKEVTDWLKEAKSKSSKYRKEEVYPYVVKQALLKQLNDNYQAKVELPTNIEGFRYHELSFKLSEEEVCTRYILAFEERVTNGELLSEMELEKYVIAHLEDIEPGLRPVQSQVILPNGRIDVLARDKEGTYVIIELKVEKDTDAVWQHWYYTNEIKKKYNTENVRFILILPQFYPEIIEPLLEGNTPTQVLQFHPTIHRGKLKEASFTHYEHTHRINFQQKA